MLNQWRIKIPEVNFVTDVTCLQISANRDEDVFVGRRREQLITIIINFIVMDASNAPAFMRDNLESFTLLAKEVDGKTKIKFKRCRLISTKLSHMSRGGVEYELGFMAEEMETIE